MGDGERILHSYTLKVLDINVWSGLDYIGYLLMGRYESPGTRKKRYQALLKQIKDLSPDVIGVHEANKLPAYTRKLARDLGYDQYSHVGVGGIRMGPLGLPWNLKEGDGILVRRDLKLSDPVRHQLSGGHVGRFFIYHLEDATQIIGVKVKFNDQPLYIFATHWHASVIDEPEYIDKLENLKNEQVASREEYQAALRQIAKGSDWRLGEADQTIDFIRRVAGKHPYILIGDFNTAEDTREIQKLLEFGAVDTFRALNPESAGHTWDPKTNLNIRKYYLKANQPDKKGGLYQLFFQLQEMEPRRPDYIYVGPQELLKCGQISIASSRLVMQDVIDGVHASDHYGIFTEIVFVR